MQIDEISHADVTPRPGGAQCVQVRLYVLRTADVERSAYTPARSHAAEPSFGNQHDTAVCAGGVERLVEAMVCQFRCTNNARNRREHRASQR